MTHWLQQMIGRRECQETGRLGIVGTVEHWESQQYWEQQECWKQWKQQKTPVTPVEHITNARNARNAGNNEALSSKTLNTVLAVENNKASISAANTNSVVHAVDMHWLVEITPSQHQLIMPSLYGMAAGLSLLFIAQLLCARPIHLGNWQGATSYPVIPSLPHPFYLWGLSCRCDPYVTPQTQPITG